jgi:hypothetical protein
MFDDASSSCSQKHRLSLKVGEEVGFKDSVGYGSAKLIQSVQRLELRNPLQHLFPID